MLITDLVALALAAAAPDTSRWTVLNHGRPAGDLILVTSADSATVRFVYTDRNRGARIENRYRRGRDGTFTSGESRPVLADGRTGEPNDRFEVVGDSVFHGPGTGGPGLTRFARRPGVWTALRGFRDTPWEQAELARHLLGRADRTAGLLPAGTVQAELIADTTVRSARGPVRARLVMLRRNGWSSPGGIWIDDRGALLATDAQWFITVRDDLVPLLPRLRSIEFRWREAQAEAMAAKVRTPVKGDLVVAGGDLFDSESGMVRPRQTIVIRGDRIAAVGPADSIAAPADATVIDARGKTVMPGMWDMHTHLQSTNQTSGSLIQLAQGLTTVRDLAADLDVAVSQRDRERAGRLASPRVILAGFIEGALRWAGPTEALARDEAEARGWVARYDSLGYRQIKLYNVLHPDLVPTIASESKRRGLLLSGHVPRGMSIRAAVGLGFDEIQHAAFLLSDFFQDSLYLPQMRAYSAVATAVAPDFDVDGPGMDSLIRFLAERGTVVDGTFNLWIGSGASAGSRQARADSTYLRLIRRLHEGGVRLVAGTDNSSGSTFRRELELYERAGIPASKVLQIATIESARFMREDREYGSLVVGKVADVVIVDGRPAEKIGDIARIERVIRGGRLYRVSDLNEAVGVRAGSGAFGVD